MLEIAFHTGRLHAVTMVHHQSRRKIRQEESGGGEARGFTTNKQAESTDAPPAPAMPPASHHDDHGVLLSPSVTGSTVPPEEGGRDVERRQQIQHHHQQPANDKIYFKLPLHTLSISRSPHRASSCNTIGNLDRHVRRESRREGGRGGGAGAHAFVACCAQRSEKCERPHAATLSPAGFCDGHCGPSTLLRELSPVRGGAGGAGMQRGQQIQPPHQQSKNKTKNKGKNMITAP